MHSFPLKYELFYASDTWWEDANMGAFELSSAKQGYTHGLKFGNTGYNKGRII